MNQRMQTAFLTLATICLLAMTSGLSVHLHLAHVDEHDEHDAAHCSLCQELAVSQKNHAVNLEPADIQIDPVEHSVSARSTFRFPQTSPGQFHPRAPRITPPQI